MFATGESARVYGRKEKAWIRAHCDAGATLVTSDTDNIKIISPRVRLWDEGRTIPERRHVRKTNNQIQRAGNQVVVIRAPPPAVSPVPLDEESSDDEEPLPSKFGAMGDFLLGQYGPDTLVEVHVPDIYRERDETASNVDGTVEVDSVVAMTILEFVECARDPASGGLNFLAGKNSAPGRPAEWWRGQVIYHVLIMGMR